MRLIEFVVIPLLFLFVVDHSMKVLPLLFALTCVAVAGATRFVIESVDYAHYHGDTIHSVSAEDFKISAETDCFDLADDLATHSVTPPKTCGWNVKGWWKIQVCSAAFNVAYATYEPHEAHRCLPPLFRFQLRRVPPPPLPPRDL
jgi:hypothetical protein